MASLREQKKQRTFDEIVAAASRMFRDDGYEATTVEAIAAEARVSPGTVYNYFGAKNAILMAVVTADTEHALEEGARSFDASAASPVDALMPVVETHLHLMASLGRETLRELIVLGFDSPQSPMFTELVTLDEKMLGQLAEVVGNLRERGMVKEDVDPVASATLIYSVIAVAVMMYLAYPEQTGEEMAAMARHQITLAVDGIGA